MKCSFLLHFHVCFHCLPEYQFRDFQNTKGYVKEFALGVSELFPFRVVPYGMEKQSLHDISMLCDLP